MEERKNIERFFQEKFKDFEATPPDHSWERIQESLNKKSNNRKVIPLWWKIAGAAALLAGILWTGNLVFSPVSPSATQGITGTKASDSTTVGNLPQESVVNNDANENQHTTPSNTQRNTELELNNEQEHPLAPSTDRTQVASKDESESNTPVKTNQSSVKKKDVNTIEPSKNEAIAQVDQTQGSPIQEDRNNPTTKDQTSMEQKAVIGNTTIDEDQILAQNNPKVKDTLNNADKPSLLDAIDEMEKETQEALAINDQNQKDLRWSVQPNVAPVYYNTLSEGSPLSQQFAENTKQGDVTISFGVNIAYQISKRLSIRSGLNAVDMGYATDGIEFGPAISSTNEQHQLNVRFHTPSGAAQQPNIALSDGKTPLYSPDSELQARSEKTYQGSINQKLGYLEVPLELKYRLVDTKIGVNIIGGFSSLFLTDNQVTISSDNNLKTEVGEASNLNDTSFSTNIGIGLDYKFSDKLLFNLEPMFKYQMGTFSSDDGGFSPYMLGVYTGLSFSF